MSTPHHRMSAPARRWAAQRQPKSASRPAGSASSPDGSCCLGAAGQLPSVLRDIGADPVSVLSRAGLAPAYFDGGGQSISLSALGRLLTASVAHTRCEHLGLLTGERTTLASLGAVGGVMQHSPTLGAALDYLVAHLRDEGAAVEVSALEDVAIFDYAVYRPGVAGTDHIADCAMAAAVTILRGLCGAEWRPDEVLLPRRCPADPQPHRRLFRASVRFDQDRAALVFPAGWLKHPLAGAEPAFRQAFLEWDRQQAPACERDLAEEVRRTLRTRLLAGPCPVEEMADCFAMHRRTLLRHLNATGTDFRRITEEIRFEVARQLLADTTIPLGQIAAALGYAEACVFTRAFRRWSGQTPNLWRAQAYDRKRSSPAADRLA